MCARFNITPRTKSPNLVPIRPFQPSLDLDISRCVPFGTPCYYKTTAVQRGKTKAPRFTLRGRLGYVVGEDDFGRGGYTVYDPFYRKLKYKRYDIRFDNALRRATPIDQLRQLQRDLRRFPLPLPLGQDDIPPVSTEPLDSPAPPIPLPSLSAPPLEGPSVVPAQPPSVSVQPKAQEKGIGERVRQRHDGDQRLKKPPRGAKREKIAGSRRKEQNKTTNLVRKKKKPKKTRAARIYEPEQLANMAESDDIGLKEKLEELQRIRRQMSRLQKEDLTVEQVLEKLHQQQQLLAAALAEAQDDTLPPTPANWDEALSGPWAKEWAAAREKEKTGIHGQGTWVPDPSHKGRTVKSRWAFRVSREQDGSLKFRARLVAKGFSERRGIDYYETFAPTVSLKALLALLHIAASKDWYIRSIDVGNAYLEADLDTVIHMELPPEPGQPRQVVRLLKSLYGLKQAGELWNRKLDGILKSMGFERCFSDACVYHRVRGTTRTYIALYVDDLLTFSNVEQELLDFEKELATKVKKLTIKGNAEGFVGMEFKRDRAKKTITLTQTQYIRDTVHSEGLDFASEKSTPAASTTDLNKAERGTKEPMRTLVGKLRYAVDHCHPEGLFIASQLSSACANPGHEHWKAATHCLRYLKGAASVGLTLGGPPAIEPEVFVDASYIEDGEARSQLGYCVRLNREAGMIYSKSSRDTATSLSASEAELRALKEATQEAMWLRYFLKEIGYPPAEATPIHEDNAAVVNLIATLKSCPRTRHLNKIRQFIIQQVQKRRIKVRKVAGERNIADILTKPLERTRFLMLRAMMLGEALK